MGYLLWLLAVLGITILLTFFFWLGCICLDNYRYKRAVDRRVRELDAEMRKRGEVL